MKKIIAIVTVLLASVTGFAKDYLIDSVQIPQACIAKASEEAGKLKITEPVLFMEVYSTSSGEIHLRSNGQSFGGNQTTFDFGKYGNTVSLNSGNFPVAVRILIGSKNEVERTARGLAGGGAGAVIGGIIGGVGAGIFSGGLGAPAGAAIGAAIGGALGGTAGAIAPITEAKEVVKFTIGSESGFVATHRTKASSNDVLTDGQEAVLIIKQK